MARRKADAKAALIAFGALVLCAVVLQVLPLLFDRMANGEAATALYLTHLYAAIPLCALALPFFAGRWGVHPLAACWPIGGLTLLLPIYSSPGVGILCIILSLVGCVAGREWKNRKTNRKGKHHGGKRKV